jgi:hypothetical protein
MTTPAYRFTYFNIDGLNRTPNRELLDELLEYTEDVLFMMDSDEEFELLKPALLDSGVTRDKVRSLYTILQDVVQYVDKMDTTSYLSKYQVQSTIAKTTYVVCMFYELYTDRTTPTTWTSSREIADNTKSCLEEAISFVENLNSDHKVRQNILKSLGSASVLLYKLTTRL